jgi:transposase-like protein
MRDRFTKRIWSPELLEELRRCYEETGQQKKAIALAFGLPESTFRRLIERHGWLRRDKPAGDTVDASASPKQPAAPDMLIQRLEQAVAQELAAIETTRSARTRKTASAADTERIVRSLERLTDTLAKVRRMREPDAAQDPDDDLPRDIDEFRRVLARRIEQLVRDRPDDDGPAGDGAGDPEAAR